MTARTQRTITIWDKCECGRTLHSISEGERGLCSTCWFKRLAPSTRTAMNRLLASAFNGSTDAQKDMAVKAAFDALEQEKQRGNP